MNIIELKETIKHCYPTKRPLFVRSSPGLGKSSACRQAAEEMGIDFIDIRLSQKAPEELGSLAFIKDDTIQYAAPSWVPTTGAGIILLDEFMDASLHVQSAMLEFSLDRRIGGVPLGDGWYVVAAGNRQEDKASAGRLSTAQANRFMHVTLEPDVDLQLAYGRANNWDPIVLYFLKYMPSTLSTFDPKSKEAAFASPRTWEYVSDVLKTQIPDHLRYPLMEGTIGADPAAKLEAFLQIWKSLTPFDVIKADPTGVPVPEDKGALYATCAMLSQNMIKNITDVPLFETLMKYINRIPIEYQIIFLDDIQAQGNNSAAAKTLIKTRSFTEWAIKNHKILLN